MIRKRIITWPNAALLVFIVATSATNSFLFSASAVPRNDIKVSPSSRWLTYACNSKNGHGRFLGRMLTHPCRRRPDKQMTDNQYNKKSTGSNSFLVVTLGILAGAVTILGLIFFIDRETFIQVTGVKNMPPYCNCSKPRIDGDDDISGPPPYERDTYLTPETLDYLEDKHGKEIEQPKRCLRSIVFCCCFRTQECSEEGIYHIPWAQWRRLRSIFWCCFKTKEYDEGDKYRVPWTGSGDGDAQAVGRNMNILLVLWEDLRLRLCWTPTKEYNERDKYDVGLSRTDDEDDGIKIAASSYESADENTVPWR